MLQQRRPDVGRSPSEKGKQLLADPDIEPLNDEEFDEAVEAVAGVHGKTCGGQFKLNAPIRCPKCKSADLDERETGLLYD